MKRLYLIGDIPNTIDLRCEKKFYQTQIQLMKIGFNVINPLERLLNKEIDIEESKKKNLRDLMFSDGIYIMPCYKFDTSKKNIELKIATDFNLIIINGILDLTPEKKTRNT